MKIQGVDNLIVNQIQEQTQKPVVAEIQRSKVENKYEKNNQDKKQQTNGQDGKNVNKTVQQLNSAAEVLNVELKFIVNKDNGRVVVKVIDKTHDKVLREIPPEKATEMVSQMQKALGLFVDERV